MQQVVLSKKVVETVIRSQNYPYRYSKISLFQFTAISSSDARQQPNRQSSFMLSF